MPWPTGEWPVGELPDRVDLDDLMAEAFDPAGPVQQTYAVVVIHRGRLVFERYEGLLPQWDKPGKPVVRDTPLLSWSMAKSLLHAVVGMLVADGRLVLDDPAPVPLWQSPGDRRGEITLQHLLHMRDGLDFVEEYEDPETSDVLKMLFGPGQKDMAAFAADRPLAAPPGTRFNYSSGASIVISAIVARIVGPGGDYRQFLSRRLFGPLGMTSATVTLDEAGNMGGGVLCARHSPGLRPIRPALLSATEDGMTAGSCPRAGRTTDAARARSTPTAVTTTARTGGCATTAAAPSGPPATRASSSTSAPTSMWSWSGWGGPTPTIPMTSSSGGHG